MNALAEYYISRKQFIESQLSQFLKGAYKNTTLDVSMDIVGGGKRLRGVLLILVCEALGGTKDDAIDYAVAAELMHAASLAHDDIIDGDTARRGKPTSWITFGVKKAVLVPHLLISHALLLIRKHGVEGLEKVLRSWVEATKGQIADTFRAKVFDRNVYSSKVTAKTSTLFAVSASLGTLAAKKETYLPFMEEYGRKIGFSFQVADDIVDLAILLRGDETIKMRNPSLPAFIAHISEGKVDNYKHVTSKLVRDALGKLSQMLKESEQILTNLPNSSYRDYLQQFPSLIVSAMLKQENLRLPNEEKNKIAGH